MDDRSSSRRVFLAGSTAAALAAVGVGYAGAQAQDAADADHGKTDVAAQARRFTKVADIVTRAIARYDQISADLGAAGPSNDPTVQAALQAINTNAQSIVNRVLDNPGPIQDPAVQRTLQGIVNLGTQLANDASAKLGG